MAEAKKEASPESKYEVTLDEALKLAQAHHRSGNLTIAERTYKDILRAVPDHFPTVYLLAALLYQRGAYDEALSFGKKATEVAPENASCWSNYAVILSALGRYEEALAAYDQTITINPELHEAYSNKSHTLWLLGRFEEAEEAASQATLLNPDMTEAYLNLGIALAAQNKLGEAEEVWAQVIEMDPNNATAYSNWCNALRTQGRLAAAKEKGEKAVELSPEDAEGCNNLACVLKDLGDYERALTYFRKATDIRPDYHIAHNNTALTLIEQEHYPEAVIAARYATSFKKDFADGYTTLSLAYKGLGQRDEARRASEKAISLEPEESFHYLILIDVLIAGDQFDEADAVLQKALSLDPTEPRALLKLAEVRRSLDMLDEAVEAIDKAIENFQETPPILIEKARILMHANRAEEALATIERALQLAPKNPMAQLTKADFLLTVNRKDEAGAVLENAREAAEHIPGFFYHLSSYKKFTADDPDFIKLKALEAKQGTYGLDMQATLHFALFNAYEDIKDYDKAFEHLQAANEARHSALAFDAEKASNGFEFRKSLFTKPVFKQYEGKGCESEVPVFIVGMPRSGTTLTEQIISSHPDVYGAGELYDLGTVVRELGPLSPENAKAMGEAYVQRVRARDKSGKALRITDKMPGNYSNIGLIRCILPRAKIIHCRRDPMDNLLSCYKQNFASGQYWSYAQESLARQYTYYNNLMDHWRAVLPAGSFLEIDYEETVNNFEQQARMLIDFTGLEWNNACLEPHKKKRAVLTASKDQVIRPIYKSSVEAWKRYEKQLQPMRAILREAGLA